jgi:two-component system, cell cycle sensor histidine kinase and response regulator CckA
VASSTTGLAKIFGQGTGVQDGSWLLIAAAAVCAAAVLLLNGPMGQLISLVAGLTFAILALFKPSLNWRENRNRNFEDRQLSALIGADATPCFSTDANGRIGFQNIAAQARFSANIGSTLVTALRDHFAAPSVVLYRLQSKASFSAAAREDVVTRRGHMRLSVHQLNINRYLWRLEEFQDRASSGRGAETLSLPMLTANKAGVVLFTNEAMRRLLGGRPKRLDRIFVGQTLHSGEEVEVLSATGPVRAILAEVEGVGERREIYLLPVAQHHNDESMLSDFEHVPVALLKFEPSGALRLANRAARDLLHLNGDLELMHDLFEGLGRPVQDWLSDVANERIPSGAEVLCARKLGAEVFLQVTLRRIVDFGRPGVLAVLQDATALKTLEAQFVQSQKMQAIGQLAGGIAHDFNNLLTAISGHCDLLLLRQNSGNPDYADLIQIHQNANRAAALVSQLLAFSRKQTLKPQRIDVQDVLSDLTHLLARLVGEKMHLQLTHASDLGFIRADKRQLEQVIMNLVVNARDAMPDGGTIRIESEAVTLKEELRRDRAVVPAGEYALIRVADSGVGIPPERLQKIFEPFFTTKRVGEGTGLGLSTAYGIVKQSGGFIFVNSTEGEGSIFQLYFPIYTASDLVEIQAPKKNIVLRQGEGVVLLVEDEAPVRAFASRALRMRGYTVLEAENAEDALQQLEDPALQVDIFVTDVVMPGMDGPSWVRQALLTRPNVKVIFVSGYSEEALSEGQSRIPNSIFLPKPFSLNDLTATVQGQLH